MAWVSIYPILCIRCTVLMVFQLTDGWHEQMLGMLGYDHLQVTHNRLRTDQFVLTIESLLTHNIWCLTGFYACVYTSLLVFAGRQSLHTTIWQAIDTWATPTVFHPLRTCYRVHSWSCCAYWKCFDLGLVLYLWKNIKWKTMSTDGYFKIKMGINLK